MKKRIRQPQANRKSQTLLVRLEPNEKEAFLDAAALAGLPLSMWVRERLRTAAIRDLENAARPIAFLKDLPSF